MLEHEQEKTETPAPAAQVRVTPEELAQALTRWQARREGTLTIGEAVQELGLDATPEELLREVQAARAQPQAQVKRRGLGRAVWAGAALGALALGLWGLTLRPRPPKPLPPPVVAARAAPPKIAAPPTTLVEDGSGPQPVLRTLAEVKDNVPVSCALAATTDAISLANYTNASSGWALIKHNGVLYIQGWMQPMSSAAMKANAVEIHSHDQHLDAGGATQEVTLRLDQLQINPAMSSDDMISAQNVIPDPHFHDR